MGVWGVGEGHSGQREQQVQRPRGGRVCEAQGGRAAAFETRPVRTRTYHGEPRRSS